MSAVGRDLSTPWRTAYSTSRLAREFRQLLLDELDRGAQSDEAAAEWRRRQRDIHRQLEHSKRWERFSKLANRVAVGNEAALEGVKSQTP